MPLFEHNALRAAGLYALPAEWRRGNLAVFSHTCQAGAPRPLPTYEENWVEEVLPDAEHLLDWFHLTMRLTVMPQSAKSLPLTVQDEEDTYVLRDAVVRELERLKWFLWHGNVYRALQGVESVEMDLDVAVATGESTARKLRKAIV
jgi:hypothetical protein